MKAWGIEKRGDESRLKIFDTPKPVAESSKVLVRIKGAALNSADIKVLQGGQGFILHANRYPLLMGYDYAGMVEATGEGVQGIRAGDEVYGFLPYTMKNTQGSFAEYLLAPQAELAHKPQSIGFPEAASLATAASTALQALRDKATLAPGQAVLINGASGGVGSVAVQIAKILGAEVWGTCRADKMEFVRALGADRVFDYRNTRLSELPKKFDAVLDVAATASYTECSGVLQPKGRYVTLLPSAAFVAGAVISLFSSKPCIFAVVKPSAADFSQIVRWVQEGRLLPQVDKLYPLDKLPEAFRDFRSGNVKGKIAFSV